MEQTDMKVFITATAKQAVADVLARRKAAGMLDKPETVFNWLANLPSEQPLKVTNGNRPKLTGPDGFDWFDALPKESA